MKYLKLFENFEGEKDPMKFPEKLWNKLTKNNGFKAKFVGDNSQTADKLANDIKSSKEKLACIFAKQMGEDKEGNKLAYFQITVNKDHLEEAKKIVESEVNISLPDGYTVQVQAGHFIDVHPPHKK